MRWFTLIFVFAWPVNSAENGEITLQAWRDMALGKTVTYFNEKGELNGFERYAPVGDNVEYQYPDGTCVIGRWWHAQGEFCFEWQGFDLPICVTHTFVDGKILAQTGPEGDAPNLVHEMVEISDRPLTCGDLTS